METRKRKKERLMKSQIQHIPDEITTQILSGLPMKSLLRFKCISKTWQSWISNMKGQERSFFYLKPNDKGNNTVFYTVDKELVVQEIPCPFQISSHEENFKFLGSCNGFLLFSVSWCIYLWNPTTRCCKEVLQLNLLAAKFDIVASGLCFDKSTNDYKVVMGLEDQRMVRKFVLVSSLKSQEWLEVNFPYAMAWSGCYVNGHLHWIVQEKKFDPDLIVYFDAKRMEFKKLPMPKNVTSIDELGVVDGCLSMADRTILKSQILVMRKYGVKESWATIWIGKEPKKKRKGQHFRLPGFDRQISNVSEELLVAKFRSLWGISVWELKLNLMENSVQFPLKNYGDYFVWDTYVESLEPIYGEPPDTRRHSKIFKDKIRWMPK